MNCDCGSEVTTAVVEVPVEKTRLTDWLKEHLSYDDIADSESFAGRFARRDGHVGGLPHRAFGGK